MFDFLVTADGGLTTAGYAVCIIAGILLFVAAIAFAGKVSEDGSGVCHLLSEDL